MDLLQFHNHFRAENGLNLLENSEILTFHAQKAAKWIGRRKFLVYWNFDRTRKILMEVYGFKDVDYNIGVGPNEETIMNHFLKNHEKKDHIFNNFTEIGFGSFQTTYRFWTVLYGLKEK